MTDEEIAQSILNPHASWFASNPRVVAAVAKALCTARNEALDEAAQLVFPDISFSQGLEIATAIRALKS
jgi:hypothetical protein